MNAPAQAPSPEDLAAFIAPRTRRHDGWLPTRQRKFLELVSDGNSVGAACKEVEMSPASAYAFRRTAPGAAFAIAWRAANILGREALEDRLLAWSLEGCEETVIKVDDKTTRRIRPNHRLALAMLTKLEEKAKPCGPDEHEAARLIAQEFDHFLDLIEADVPGVCTAFLTDRLAQSYEPSLRRGLQALERADARMGVPVPERPEKLKGSPWDDFFRDESDDDAEGKGDGAEPRYSSLLRAAEKAGAEAPRDCNEGRHTSQLRDCDQDPAAARRASFEALCRENLGHMPIE